VFSTDLVHYNGYPVDAHIFLEKFSVSRIQIFDFKMCKIYKRTFHNLL